MIRDSTYSIARSIGRAYQLTLRVRIIQFDFTSSDSGDAPVGVS